MWVRVRGGSLDSERTVTGRQCMRDSHCPTKAQAYSIGRTRCRHCAVYCPGPRILRLGYEKNGCTCDELIAVCGCECGCGCRCGCVCGWVHGRGAYGCGGAISLPRPWPPSGKGLCAHRLELIHVSHLGLVIAFTCGVDFVVRRMRLLTQLGDLFPTFTRLR